MEKLQTTCGLQFAPLYLQSSLEVEGTEGASELSAYKSDVGHSV